MFKKKIFIIIGICLVALIMFLIFNFENKNSDYDHQKFLILNGNDEVAIYQNSVYVEPGYEAYNSKGKSLKGMVRINGNVDTSSMGEYVITYQLDNVIKERRVYVVSKGSKLNGLILLGETTMYLKVGSTYKEPGYKLIGNEFSNLIDSVAVNGNVDTNKVGTYTIVYSITNNSGITVSEKRNVVVVDSNFDFIITPSDYTKDDVSINISVLDSNFDYMILPNGEKNYDKNLTYGVSENGIYKFKLFSKDGSSSDSEIMINNIDREIPKINSCNITMDNFNSTVEVNALDNVNIQSYTLYNKDNIVTSNSDTSFSFENIELNNQYIVVSDVAGNVAKLNCTIDDVRLNVDINQMASYLNSTSKAQIVTFSRGRIVDSYATDCNKNDALYISSGSKTILGLTAAKMAQDGIVSLDENIATYWHNLYTADFNTYSDNWRKLMGSESTIRKYADPSVRLVQNSSSLRHSLTHSSTVKNIEGMMWMVPGDHTTEYFGGGLSKTYARAIFMLRHNSGQLFESKSVPGTKTIFSYLDDKITREHAIVGFTLQISMKETIDEYLKKVVWDEIGANSNPSFDAKNSIHFATSYKTSAEDLAKLIAAVSNDGVYNGKMIFSKDAVNEIEKVESHLANQTIAFNYINGKYVKYGTYSYVTMSSYYDVDKFIPTAASFISYDPNTSKGFVVITDFKKESAKKESNKMFDLMSNYFYNN